MMSGGVRLGVCQFFRPFVAVTEDAPGGRTALSICPETFAGDRKIDTRREAGTRLAISMGEMQLERCLAERQYSFTELTKRYPP